MILEHSATTIKDSAVPPLRRLISSCEGRSAITGEVLNIGILSSQVAFRAMFLAKSTSNAEMSALRAFLHGFTVGSDDPNREEIIKSFEWIGKARVKGLSEASAEASMPPSSYAQVTKDLVSAFRKGVRGRSLDGLSDEELMRHVSGVRRENPIKVRNRENKSLLWRDYLNIMMDLAEYDPAEAMTAFVEKGTFSPGVARVMIATLFLTGIRPVEIFGINVYSPRTDIRYNDHKRELTRKSPISAIGDGILRPIAVEARHSGLSRGQTLVRAAKMTAAAPNMSILSAKQQNANKDLRFPMRFLVLEDISPSDANLICWAAEFRNADSSESARRRLSTQATAILRAICASNPEMRQDVNLYTFRHSFASRARAALEENECAALTGHTAARTFRGYGERAPKVKGRGWLPTPDPERANMIEQIWDGLVISQDIVQAEHDARQNVIMEQIAESMAEVSISSTSSVDSELVETDIGSDETDQSTPEPDEDVEIIDLPDPVLSPLSRPNGA